MQRRLKTQRISKIETDPSFHSKLGICAKALTLILYVTCNYINKIYWIFSKIFISYFSIHTFFLSFFSNLLLEKPNFYHFHRPHILYIHMYVCTYLHIFIFIYIYIFPFSILVNLLLFLFHCFRVCSGVMIIRVFYHHMTVFVSNVSI